MATCKVPSKEFIRNSFLPQIAVACSESATQICQKNNLSFTELLQPFCKLGTEVQYKDAFGTSVSLKNFKISLVDVNSRPPQPTLARKLLNLSVSEAHEPRLQKATLQNYTIDLPTSVPWFESWRETFLQVQFPSDHEFTKHYLSCMFVISSVEQDPMQTIVQLVQSVMQVHNTNPTKITKWFSKDILFYYIMLHENLNGNHVQAVEYYDKMKATYGTNNCFLLRMNSRPPGKTEQLPDPWSRYIVNRRVHIVSQEAISPPGGDGSPNIIKTLVESPEFKKDGNNLEYHPLSPDRVPEDETLVKDLLLEKQKSVVHGVCLTTEDVEQIKLLIHEFCTRALLPYVERQINILSDFITNKKGVSRSLFSATKRWFTTNKPGGPGATAASTLLYSPDSPELQTRRLGDLCFMFCNYHVAYEAYHSAKKDFIADQAWLYYAGALEMASLSAFMGNGSTKKTCDYMEESITTYLNTCKMPQFATRATLLSSECLKSQQSYGEAAHQLIRMTSEESDLRSAILLEQAAYCFLFNKPCMIRKYAFHMVLAGHRFSKALQRRHSLKCYKQAFQIYQDKGWNLAEDHIHYTIGRQANNLCHLEEAVESYSHLLTGYSKQSAEQQILFLKEYLSTFSALLRQQNIFLTQVLPLPLLRTKSTKILLGLTTPLKAPGRIPALDLDINTKDDIAKLQRWNKLEEMLVQEAQGSLPMIFKPLKTVFTLDEVHSTTPYAVISEPIHVNVQLENKFLIHLYLKDIFLLWKYSDGKKRFASNEITGGETESFVKTAIIDAVTLNPNSTQEISLSIIPTAVGEIVLKGICYCLLSSQGSGNENEVSVKGKQVFKINPKSKGNDKNDKQFKITVVPEAPCLQVTFSEVNTELLQNEIQKISVELKNAGNDFLHNIYIATSKPYSLSSCDFREDKQNNVDYDLETLASKEKLARKNHLAHLKLPNEKLEPGQTHNFNIWLKAPEEIGLSTIDLLIYYENVRENSVPRYRLVRHEWTLLVREAIKIEVQTTRSVVPDGSSHSLILSTRITNLSQIISGRNVLITPTNVALISPNWSLRTDTIIPEKIRIHCQESISILIKANKTNRNDLQSTYSQVFFDGNKFMNSFEAALLDFAHRDKRNDFNIFEDLENVQLPSKDNSDTIFVLRWHGVISDGKGNKRTFFGQNRIILDIQDGESFVNRNEKLLYQETKFDFEFPKIARRDDGSKSINRQIKYNVDHPPLVKADFSNGKIHLVPIKLVLHSLIEYNSVVTVKAINGRSTSNMPMKSVMFHPHPSSQFCWVSKNTIQKPIGPYGIETVDFQIAILGPGTYDLGAHLEIWCTGEDEIANLQMYRNTSALVVEDSSA